MTPGELVLWAGAAALAFVILGLAAVNVTSALTTFQGELRFRAAQPAALADEDLPSLEVILSREFPLPLAR